MARKKDSASNSGLLQVEAQGGLQGAMEDAASYLKRQGEGGQAEQSEQSTQSAIPALTDIGWSDYVLSKFERSELDEEGRPYVKGLRRVSELLLGPTLESTAHVVQAPQIGQSGRMLSVPAVVAYTIKILWTLGEEPHVRTFSDVADVWDANTEVAFCRFPTATASTRAEARCYRKALKLTKVSADEVTRVPVPSQFANQDALIEDAQLILIDKLCERMDVNAVTFINSGELSYANPRKIPWAKAALMIEKLSGWQNKQGGVSEQLRGYQKGWY